ncbi:MAG: hypothetical protein EZS28_014560, partial [Streblomastix strix]
YANALVLSFSTTYVSQQYGDQEIIWGLINIAKFVSELRHGRKHPYFSSFVSLPEFSKVAEEQVEEEGGYEELEGQLINKGKKIIENANQSKRGILNYYIYCWKPMPQQFIFF